MSIFAMFIHNDVPMKLKSVIKSMRLRTLPLSLAGVVLGVLLAASESEVSFWVALSIMFTTVCLQVLSNLSNELGDVLSGADGEDRQGPEYGLNSGEMTIRDMRKLIAGAGILCMLSGLLMIRLSFGSLIKPVPVAFICLGAFAIWGATRYTLGKNPYGYRGLGDVFVFIFFGIVSVAGGFSVAAHAFDPLVLLPAAAIGCFSVGVLNVNNIRDMRTDAPVRVTVAIKLGLRKARIYQSVLVVFGLILMAVYCLLKASSPWPWLYVLTIPLYVKHLRGVWTLEDRALDPMLPLLVMSTFALSLLAGIGFVI